MYENIVNKMYYMKLVKVRNDIFTHATGFHSKYLNVPLLVLFESENTLDDPPVRLSVPFTLCLCPMRIHTDNAISRVHPRAVQFVKDAREIGMVATNYAHLDVFSHQFPIRIVSKYGREYGVTSIATTHLEEIITPNSFNKSRLKGMW